MEAAELGKILKKQCGIIPGNKVLVACSGGADSTALLLMLHELSESYPLEVFCVHVEHGIRGETSRRDASFVESLCQKLAIPCRVFHVDVPGVAGEKHIGMEEAARMLRYQCLKDERTVIGADAIALAHHRLDQAETILMHLFRGCDMDALSGMPWRDGPLIRPLLGTDSEELRAYLTGKGVSWCEDETNSDIRYTRNRIRNVLLPEIERAYPRATRAILRLSEAALRDKRYFDDLLSDMNIEEHLLSIPAGLCFPRDILSDLPESLASRALGRLLRIAKIESQGRDKMTAMLDALTSGQETAVNLEGNARFRLWRNQMLLTRDFHGANQRMESGEESTCFGRFTLREAKPNEIGDGAYEQRIPLRLMEEARITPVFGEDLFHPFGGKLMSAQKYLAAVPFCLELRKRIPVLRAADGEILWMCGIRASERIRMGNEASVMVTWEYGRNIAKVVSAVRSWRQP